MPFKSKKQARWMFATHPKMAKKWAHHTPDMKGLPELAEFFPEKIPGGEASGRSPDEFDPVELKKGMRHEMEHADDPKVALEIAMDHLVEDPHYYSDLEAAGRLFSAES